MSIRTAISRPAATVAMVLGGVAAGLLLTTGSAASQPDRQVQSFLRTYGQVEESKREFAEALLGFVTDLEGSFGNEGYRLRAAIETMQGSLSAWNTAVDTLANLTDALDTAGARLALARVYLDQHRLDDARREGQRAVELDATRADGYALLGTIALVGSDPAVAAEALRQATLSGPDDALAFYQLASTYDLLGQPSEAAEARHGFAAAAEQRLGALWRSPAQRLSDTEPVLGEPSSFVVRRAPIDLVANAGGAFVGFMPSAYENAATQLTSGNYAQAVSVLRDTLVDDVLTRDVPEPGHDLDQRLQAARSAASSPNAGPAAHDAVGRLLMALDQPDAARQAFTHALELDPTLESPRLRLAAHALEQMDGGGAITHLETAVTQHPRSSEARRLLGQAFWATEDIAAAVQHYSAALALAPTDERLRTARQGALLRATANDPIAAEIAATAASHPRSGIARRNLGRFLQDVGRNADALAAYGDAVQRSPLVAVARLHLRIGEMYSQQLQIDEAIDSFRAALAIDLNNLVPRQWIARLLMEDGRLDESYAEYLVMLLLDPLNAEVHARLAQIELQRGAFVKAVALARRAVIQDPDHMQARYALGQALLRSGATDEGRSEIAEYARRQSEQEDSERQQRDLGALNERALALAGAGQMDDAIDLLRQAIDLDPSGMAHTNLGLALMEAGRVAEAIDSFETAARVVEDAEAVYLYLADAYTAVGRSQDGARVRALHEQLRAERLGRNRRNQ